MELLTQLVRAANAASRPVASTLHLCLCLTYAAHLYRNRHDWAKGQKLNRLRSLLLFPLMGGHRHAVFQVIAWALWTLSASITLPVYLSLLAADGRGSAADGIRRALLSLFGLRKPLIPLTHVDAASGAAAVSGLWGEFFMLKALLVFEGVSHANGQGQRLSGKAAAAKQQQKQQQQDQCALPQDKVELELERQGEFRSAEDQASEQEARQDLRPNKQLLEGPVASFLVCVMGMALSVTGFVLLLSLEHLPDIASGVLYCCLALACILIGASSTHGLGGHLCHCAGAAGSAGAAVLRGGASAAAAAASVAAGAMHGSGGVSSEDEEDDVGSTWRFFQPFRGGSVFVATQAIGWTLFSSTVVAVLLLAKQLVAGVGYCLRCWAVAVGALMVATQLTLGVSILTFQNRRRARKLLQPVLHHPGASFGRAAGLVLPVVMMYLPLHVNCACIASVFALLPPRLASAAVAAVLLPYFAITLRGHPAHSGCRRWEGLCRWFSREVEGCLAWWSGRLEVIRDFPETAHQAADQLDRGGEREQQQQQLVELEGTQREEGPPDGRNPASLRRYVLGFHPHGLYPTGAGFLPLMPSVQSAFPGRTIVTLTASIVHYLPGLRDIAGWAGFRQVTRATFRRALRDMGAVLLCPGGQAELVYADRAFPPRGSPAAAVAAAAATLIGGGSSGAAASPAPLQVLEAAAPASDVAGGSAAGPPPASAPAPIPRPMGRCPKQRHQLVIYAGHQGFVRLALEEGAWLVPVLALGETLQLRNLISAPEMQRATYKRIGFPVPFILAGRWGLTTLPLRNPLIYVIGRPLQPPAGWEAERSRQLAAATPAQGPSGRTSGDKPSNSPSTATPHSVGSSERGCGEVSGAPGSQVRQRQRKHHAQADGRRSESVGSSGSACGVVVPQGTVDEYHSRFYAALAALWQRYHGRHPVLRHAELLLEWGRVGPPADFERHRRQAEGVIEEVVERAVEEVINGAAEEAVDEAVEEVIDGAAEEAVGEEAGGQTVVGAVHGVGAVTPVS